MRVPVPEEGLAGLISPLPHLGFLVGYPDVQRRGRRRDGA